MLEADGTIRSSEIMAELSVSDMTVRRDLDELEGQGLLERVHGGARLQNLYRQEELSHSEKKIVHYNEKEKIAKRAVEFINDGDTVFLGPGTTVELTVQYIQADFLRIVTNCQPIFDRLNQCKKNWKIYLIGGELRVATQCFIGEITNKSLMDMNFHKSFFSCNALSGQKIMTATFEEGQTQQIALNNSVDRYLLIDHSKIGKSDFSVFYNLRDVTAVITNKHERRHYEVIEKATKHLV
ncbi:hypothetical protein RV07_GL002904 [Enterococcus malodoratus]|nr:hypothetical protein RV07_GL002904 [Enterococcus malodoratus]